MTRVTRPYAKPGYKYVLGDRHYTLEESQRIQDAYDRRHASDVTGQQDVTSDDIRRIMTASASRSPWQHTANQRNCIECGTTYTAYHGSQRYCGEACRRKNEKRRAAIVARGKDKTVDPEC